ncbi:TIGR02302 family protein [Pelagibius litoralis]|uniref:TIGR02302 family protein n=1 Tax=Pelagibius litoralis TaxID=374515 RepID=A0A967C6I7_9PROT|nr:TIGR02302 family protein [Pelagibius litoralis]NIA68426.1 TIGR02302 family protein [Pelagibius litoralis]
MTSRRPQTPSSDAGSTRSDRKLRHFGWLLGLARGAVAWETIWPAIWPVLGIFGLFLSLALFGILPTLPAWLHLLVLIGFLGALGHGLWRAKKAITLPDQQAAKRRLERDSDLSHRPLTALDDRMMTGHGDPASKALWRVHQHRAIRGLSGLRVRAPRPGLAGLDPWALRGFVLLLIVVAFASSDGNVTSRLASAVSPQFSGQAALPPSLDAWINPPTYTGLAPLYLDATAENKPVLRVPSGSVLLAQVQGGDTAPSLKIDETLEPFEPFAQNAYRLERQLSEGTSLSIQQGSRDLAEWPLELIADTPPQIVFESAPGRSERSALRITYQAEDDYGLVTAKAIITRIDKPEETPLEIDLVVPGAAPKISKAATYRDLTPHPWAGLAVEIQLVARDHPGQEGRSETLRTVLPERIFNHPVARALVELRKQLTLNPQARLPVVQSLSALYERPDHFFHDLVVALAIRSAERRLIYDPSAKAITEVQQLLWDTALRIEEGELAIAERALRDAQQALAEALERGADDAEIQRLMDELQAALDNFLDELAEQMREQMAQGEQPSEQMPPNAQMLNRQDLQSLIERARELAQSGAREAAQELLSQLREMLENLTANPYAGQMNQDMQDASRMMENLENMMREQQDLLDRSFNRSQQGQQQNSPQGQGEGEGQNQRQGQSDNMSDAQRQEELRRSLGELMRQLGDAMGDIPRPLGRAEREMRDARDALSGEQPGQAVPPQTRSLDQLQQGMQATLDRFMEMFANQPGETGEGSVSGRPGPANRDPLGREREGSSGNTNIGEGVQIPDQMELQRSREIVDELRRRRGQRNRSLEELDYIDRLLKQF